MTPVARRNRTRHRRGFNGAVAQHHGRRVEYSNSVLRSTMLQWDHGSTPRTTSVHQAGRVASRYPFNGTVAQHQGRPRLRGPWLNTTDDGESRRRASETRGASMEPWPNTTDDARAVSRAMALMAMLPSMRPCSTPQRTSAEENDIAAITYCGTCERCRYAIHTV